MNSQRLPGILAAVLIGWLAGELHAAITLQDINHSVPVAVQPKCTELVRRRGKPPRLPVGPASQPSRNTQP